MAPGKRGSVQAPQPQAPTTADKSNKPAGFKFEVRAALSALREKLRTDQKQEVREGERDRREREGWRETGREMEEEREGGKEVENERLRMSFLATAKMCLFLTFLAFC